MYGFDNMAILLKSDEIAKSEPKKMILLRNGKPFKYD
jgi:hypothetical protein